MNTPVFFDGVAAGPTSRLCAISACTASNITSSMIAGRACSTQYRGSSIVVIETKGEHLKNDDSNRKIRLGRAWANMSGNGYRYYMVFEDGVTPPDGAVTLSELVRILEKL